MRALVVRPPAAGVELIDRPAPVRTAGAISVSVLECGVCGTDHDIADGKYGRAPAGTSYLTLGHENLGVVAEGDPSAPEFAPGDLVVATVRRGCGKCRFCLADRSDFCETGEYTERGIAGADGYMAERYVDVPEYLVRVPPALRSVAVLLEPLSVVEKALVQGQLVLDRKEPTPGHPPTDAPQALIAGTGAIGMLAALVLILRGYRVTAIDRHGEATFAAHLLGRVGARHVNVVGGYDALATDRFELILEATGSVSVDFSAIELLGPNGVLVLTGIPDASAPPSSVPGGEIFRQIVLGNRAVVGSVNANRMYFESGLRDLAVAEERWPGTVGSMITARKPIEAFAEVFADRGGGAVKSVLTVRPGGAIVPS
jgi:glucose 1-dehydrogenase